jgi:LPXTG-motif cell wall-anchored protein
MKRPMLLLAAVGLVWATMLAPDVQANTWNKKTNVTFNEPVELPGGVVLQQGEYVFKLVDSPSNRHIVQVYNANEDHLYATILAVPDFRLEPSDETVITFHETPGGGPRALRNWFYPGDNVGQEFTFKPSGKIAGREQDYVAQMNVRQIPNPPAEQAPQPAPQPEVAERQPEPEPAPAPVAEVPPAPAPEPQETERQEIAQARPPEQQPAPIERQQQMPRELPATGSNMPLLGLIGLLSLAGALGVRVLATSRRTS